MRAAVLDAPRKLSLREIPGSVAGRGVDMHQALTLPAHDRIVTEPLRRETQPLANLETAIEDSAADPALLKVQIEVAA